MQAHTPQNSESSVSALLEVLLDEVACETLGLEVAGVTVVE